MDFGLFANPKATLQHNFNQAISAISTSNYQQPTNLAFHNLCKNIEIHVGTKQLLGLNLKFCLSSRTLNNDINATIRKMAYSIRTKHFLMEHGTSNETNYIKQIYIRNSSWNPPPAPTKVEDGITNFEKLIKASQNRLTLKNRIVNLSNLTTLQSRALKLLRQNKQIIIKPTDKNLGPALLELDEYIHQVLQEHLLTPDYVQLTQQEVNHRMSNLQHKLKQLVASNQSLLTKAEITYFNRSLKAHFRIPVFYGLPKVHKHPMSLRPVVSTHSSLLAVFSVWLDFKMKDLLHLIQSFLKDSYSLIKELKDLKLPDSAQLFTADAKSMYTNIDSTSGISALRELLTTNAALIPTDFPKDLFLQVLEIVMSNNVFSFADSYWLQLSGTAMGTPAACSYATLSYGHYENTTLIPKFKANLLYYRRYIDDVFGIWIPSTTNNGNTWSEFRQTLNNWGKLKWSLDEPTRRTNFLDLNIEIKQSDIHFSTFQKPLNLHLYIPPLSAHPQSCLKGLITGEIRRYWLQNSPTDFQDLVTKFIERLHARGHTIKDLLPLLNQATATLDNYAIKNQKPDSQSQNTLYIHWTHHPKGISRSEIRQSYKQSLEPHSIHDRMIVAISRPKNLRDILTRTVLTLPDNKSIQSYINEHRTDNSP
jgi:hypothetical protein